MSDERLIKALEIFGIGALGTALLGIVLHGEPATPGRLVCIALIAAGVMGLKVFSR